MRHHFHHAIQNEFHKGDQDRPYADRPASALCSGGFNRPMWADVIRPLRDGKTTYSVDSYRSISEKAYCSNRMVSFARAVWVWRICSCTMASA